MLTIYGSINTLWHKLLLVLLLLLVLFHGVELIWVHISSIVTFVFAGFLPCLVPINIVILIVNMKIILTILHEPRVTHPLSLSLVAIAVVVVGVAIAIVVVGVAIPIVVGCVAIVVIVVAAVAIVVVVAVAIAIVQVGFRIALLKSFTAEFFCQKFIFKLGGGGGGGCLLCRRELVRATTIKAIPVII
jgi:hypothetical protein